jgi:hypothetical protein
VNSTNSCKLTTPPINNDVRVELRINGQVRVNVCLAKLICVHVGTVLGKKFEDRLNVVFTSFWRGRELTENILNIYIAAVH